MTTPQPGRRRPTGDRPDDDAGMDTCTVGLPRWRFVRLFGPNPLVRASDRVEALVLVLAVVLSLLAVPIAGAVGTAVYDSRRHPYAEQAQTQRTVTATVIDGSAALNARSKTTTVHARWLADGAEYTGTIHPRQPVKPGDSIDIRVDNDGSRVDPPPISPAGEAVMIAVATWFAGMVVAATLLLGTWTILNRIRHAGWQHDFDNLVSGDGHPSKP